jgi:hypothetical protein
MGLIGLFIRILSGERLRKATPGELRWSAGFFAFIPVFLPLGAHLGGPYLDRASGVGIWFYMMAGMLGAFLWLAIWTRFVPPAVSWAFGAVVWVVVLWLALTNRLV